ncbi:hypothetical protein [Marilutibacter maris]|uniref:hypothetical protein n=1 Tax=Marilutibacter maris TaxID=1605891 RepID=UPI0011AE49DA|nr:hypothetical protein [Lysobacter maris]
MNSAFDSIQWKEPWRTIQFAVEAQHIQNQQESEISSQHPLFRMEARAVGRRVDNDDVAAVLKDGTYVNVHLIWGSAPEAFPAEYPHWFPYGSLEQFIRAMKADSADYRDGP